MEKYTKKASAKVLKEVLKINPKASGYTSFDQAFVILMTEWNLELSIGTDVENNTTCILHRDEDKVREWVLADVFDRKVGDWDWTTIYKTVLEDIIKEKLYKRPKLGKRALKKLEEEKAKAPKNIIDEDDEEVESPVETKPATKKPSLEQLRETRGRLSARISNAKKRGMKMPDLERELEAVKQQIKELSKTK